MDPIAIIGLACRLPGAGSPEAFWSLLRDGTDSIREVPAERWDLREFYHADASTPGRMNTRWGGFLDRIDGFDPYFFGISPREAVHMDPQQRLLLEVAWEALDDAGQVVDDLAGARVGVFVGISTFDYGARQIRDPGTIVDGYVNTGSALSVAANRISYLFDFRGPSLALDTACSSSLVATHLACRSLLRGESSLALAGGVNVILSPAITIGFSKLSAMSPEGRCKAFDASADGYVRGEGAAVVVLKPLARALSDGDRIHAVIRGSAMNQDGRTNGLTAPNGPAQEAVIREALADANVEPARIAYVEAHGTGTRLGDPIELNALGAVLSEGRPPGSRCAVGSVKTNIGHLEAAAGVAGLVKVALCLGHRQIPPSLHFKEPNPLIAFDRLPLRVQRELEPWPEGVGPALAGLSSFGFGGTNVHMILEEPTRKRVQPRDATPEQAHLLALSARGPAALEALARAYLEFAQEDRRPPEPGGEASAKSWLRDVCYTAGARRTHHDYRLALVVRSRSDLAGQLQGFLAGEMGPGASSGRRPPGARHKVVFVFPGQGAQWPRMGARLLRDEPVFRDALERFDRAMRPHADWSLLEEITAPEERSRLEEVDVVQPALCAVQIALAALWRSWGIEPDAVVGQSLGEVAAAHVAGALDVDDAARVICRRSRLVKKVSGRGAMAVVDLSLDEARDAVRGFEQSVSVAVSSSPTSTVLSGDPAAMEEILERLRSRDVFCRLVKVDYASHSPQMDPLRGELLEVLQGLAPRPALLPFYSTLTGTPDESLVLDADYWARNLREPVLFSAAVERLLADGHDVFLEISPHPIVLSAIQQGLHHAGREGTVLVSLRRDEDERTVMLGSLGTLYALGSPVRWGKLHRSGGRCVALPSYPWQRERLWIEEPSSASRRGGWVPSPAPAGGGERDHPLLMRRLRPAAAREIAYWEADLSAEHPSYLADHRVDGAIVVPAALYLEMALAAAGEFLGPGPLALESVEFRRALLVPADSARTLQLVLSRTLPGEASLELFSLGRNDAGGEASPVAHAVGTIRRGDEVSGGAERVIEPREIPPRGAEAIAPEEHYAALARMGLQYGPGFRWLTGVWRDRGEGIGRLEIPEALRIEAGAYRLHPGLLDACFQVLAAALPEGAGASGGPLLPVKLGRIRIAGDVPAEAARWVQARVRAGAGGHGEGYDGDVLLRGEDGSILVEVQGLILEPLERQVATARAPEREDCLYGVEWRSAPPRATQAAPRVSPARGRWILFTDGLGVGRKLAELLEARGESCVSVAHGEDRSSCEGAPRAIHPEDTSAVRAVLAETCGESAPPCAGIVHLWSLDAPSPEDRGAAALEEARRLGCGSVLSLVQAIGSMSWQAPPRLWLVTSGAQPAAAEDGPLSVAQSPLWGLAATLSLEQPELRCTSVDLPARCEAREVADLAEELWRDDDGERRVAYRSGDRRVARIVRRSPRESLLPPLGPERRLVRLEIPEPGILDNLIFRPRRRPEPGPDEVEVRVAMAGLNFRDVLLAMGLLPPLPDGSVALGFECAGEVSKVGDRVEGLREGDGVIAVGAHSLGTHVTTPATFVARIPPGLGFEEAATIPIAFLTAYHALCRLARLGPKERILVHSATGAVGLASIQIARKVGAVVLATAGSHEKREFLRSLGIPFVADSRSLEFAAQVMEWTAGEGVDVVLNSLAGAAVQAGLSVLRPGGRFIELGKGDLLHERGESLPPRPGGNLSWSAVDLFQLAREQRAVFGDLLRDSIRYFEEQGLEPLPRQAFPASDAAAAFQTMAQARHVGKVLISLRDLAAAHEPTAGSYLVTGGLGGLGLRVASWLVEQGARHLVLAGRSAPSTEALRAVRDLEAAGSRVTVRRLDVADERQVSALVTGIDPPLKGIVHAAGVLDDGLLLNLDAERLRSVMRPKVEGSFNLHAATRGIPLDFFVLFSSAVSLLGSPGQGNYAAANAFLDALAHHRKSAGLPALSINWGPWADVGLAARAGRGDRLAAMGVESLTPRQGIEHLARLIGSAERQVGVVPVGEGAWGRLFAALGKPPLLSVLAGGDAPGTAPSTAAGDETLVATLLAATPDERRSRVESLLAEHVARVLRVPIAKLDVHQPLNRLGIDSLMAVELKNRIERQLGVTIPLIRFVEGPSIARIAEFLAAGLAGEGAPGAPSPSGPAIAPAGARRSLLLSLLSLADDAKDKA